MWACIREHESGDDYSTDTGNGYSGAYQFTPSTWATAAAGAGYPGYADGPASDAPPAVQDAAAQYVLDDMGGWSNWPVSSAACGV